MRPLAVHELPLVRYLFDKAGLTFDPNQLLVETMDDGGMGSLAFAPIDSARRFGGIEAGYVYVDSDGVAIDAALMVDREGRPFELDMFKADSGQTLRWPAEAELEQAPK